MRLCDRQMGKKYLVGDILRAKCGASLRIDVLAGAGSSGSGSGAFAPGQSPAVMPDQDGVAVEVSASRTDECEAAALLNAVQCPGHAMP